MGSCRQKVDPWHFFFFTVFYGDVYLSIYLQAHSFNVGLAHQTVSSVKAGLHRAHVCLGLT